MERKSFVPSVYGGRTPSQANRPSNVFSAFRRNQPSMTGRSSFANEYRHSIAAGGAFSLGGCRASAIPGQSQRRIVAVPKIQNIPDERNLKDRTVQQAMIAKIVNFLADCFNPQPPFNFDDPQFLRKPNKADFKNAFEFIFQNIQPSYQVKKLEDEVLSHMNNLGFPYPLKTAQMQTMTVPIGGSWPVMLSILDWLVDIVELENSIHNENNQIGDAAKWKLLTSCYKRSVELRRATLGGPTLNNDMQNFEQEFQIYRQSKLGEDEDEDGFDEMRARRVGCEQKLKVLQDKMEEETKKIASIEEFINDKILKDIDELEKYCTEMIYNTSLIEQTKDQIQQRNDALCKTIEQLQQENQMKEQQISTQKMSGNEARQLMTKRQSVREESSIARERLAQMDNKIYELQSKFYKQSAKVRSDYNALNDALHGLCESHCNTDEFQQQMSWLQQYTFEQAFSDFQKAGGTGNKLSQLVIRLREHSNQKMLDYKKSDEHAIHQKAELHKQIRELESEMEKCHTKQQLEIQRAKREQGDKMPPVRDLKHNLDVLKQKHRTTSESLGKFNDQLNSLHEELAEKHKKYLDYKQKLDGQYSELQAAILEKMTKLCDKFQLIQENKKRFKELAEEILVETAEIEKKLSAKDV